MSSDRHRETRGMWRIVGKKLLAYAYMLCNLVIGALYAFVLRDCVTAAQILWNENAYSHNFFDILTVILYGLALMIALLVLHHHYDRALRTCLLPRLFIVVTLCQIALYAGTWLLARQLYTIAFSGDLS